ncbi:MAG: 30S ribosomal protein S20 [Deltaproteobacteria bacterium]|nr:30S ribosomal protein S20 [Deltaproteobacteria bacterium]
MANHKSALKRARQSEVRRVRNSGYKSNAKKAVKVLRAAVANGSAEEAKEGLARTTSLIQKSVSKGVIHKNTASRKISRLARQVNRLTASQ